MCRDRSRGGKNRRPPGPEQAAQSGGPRATGPRLSPALRAVSAAPNSPSTASCTPSMQSLMLRPGGSRGFAEAPEAVAVGAHGAQVLAGERRCRAR
eukprot:scaffold7430_cov60-Phaeocystis_antarctica.AAC.2